MTNSDGTHQGLSQKNAGQASIHDTLFYKVFGNAKRAAAELKAILPQNLSREVDWETLRVEPNRFVDEQLRNHFADILLSVQIRKRKTYLHLLFEHSSNPKSHELLQALRYQVRLWESEDKPANEAGVRPLTPVLTVILHHSETGWRGKCRFADYFEMGDDTAKMFGPFLVDFGVFVDDLSRLGVEELLARPVPADVQVMLFALRFGRTGGDVLKELPKIEPQLRELKEQQHGTVALKLFFLYIRQVARVSGEQLRMAVQNVFEPVLDPEVAALWDLYDALHDRYYAMLDAERRGIRKGKREGKREGKASTLSSLLTARFGELPAEFAARLKAASLKELKRVELRVLSAATLDEVFAK